MKIVLRNILFQLLFFIISFNSAAQNIIARKDSVFKELAREKVDTTIAKLYFNLSVYNEKLHEIDSSIVYLTKALRISEKVGFKRIAAYSMANLGYNFIQIGEVDSALIYLNKALLIMEYGNSKYHDLLNSLGNAYFLKGNYLKAYDYFLKYLKRIENSQNQQLIARANSNVGVILKEQKKYDDALVFFNKSLAIGTKINNRRNMYVAYINIGNVYSEKSNNGKSVYHANLALENYYKAKEILGDSKEGNDESNKIILLGNIGNIYADLKQYDKAIIEYSEAINILKGHENFGQTALIYNNLSAVYIDMQNPREAEKYLALGRKAAAESNSPDDFMENYKNYSRYFELIGDYKNAYNYQLRYKTLSDSLFNTETAEKRKEIELNAEFEKKEAETKAEQDRKELIAKEEKQKQRIILYAFIAGFILMLIVAVLIFRGYRQKQKSNEIITRQKHEVEKQKELVEEKQKEIMDSIRYARRIQQSLLPTEKYFAKNLKETK